MHFKNQKIQCLFAQFVWHEKFFAKNEVKINVFETFSEQKVK